MSSPLLSHRDYSSLAETAYLARTIDRHEQLPELMKVVGSFVPYEYSVVGHFSLINMTEPPWGTPPISRIFVTCI